MERHQGWILRHVRQLIRRFMSMTQKLKRSVFEALALCHSLHVSFSERRKQSCEGTFRAFVSPASAKWSSEPRRDAERLSATSAVVPPPPSSFPPGFRFLPYYGRITVRVTAMECHASVFNVRELYKVKWRNHAKLESRSQRIRCAV
jgi:hypothetical protein